MAFRTCLAESTGLKKYFLWILFAAYLILSCFFHLARFIAYNLGTIVKYLFALIFFLFISSQFFNRAITPKTIPIK